jgi:hypothetical protein
MADFLNFSDPHAKSIRLFVCWEITNFDEKCSGYTNSILQITLQKTPEENRRKHEFQ